MTKMLALWVTLYFGGLVRGIVHPIYPLVSYLIFYYLPPHLNWWGDVMPDLRYSLLASAVLVASLVLRGGALAPVAAVKNHAFKWFALFGANSVMVTMLWSLNAARSWVHSIAVLKLVLLYALIPATIRTQAHFDVFGAFHVAGAFYWGYKAWDDPNRSAGRLEDVGGPDTQNDNQAAGHLLTVIPFAAVYVLTERRKFRQFLAVVAAGFIVNVFILCNSRGATLGLLAGGLAAVVLAGKGRRMKLVALGVGGLFMLLLLADTQFIERQQTTADPQDNSAQSRLEMWRAGLEIIRDYPLGGGGRTFHILSPRYIPEILANDRVEERSPHNTFVQLATDWGVQGTVIYALFLIATFRMLHQVRQQSRDNPWYFYRGMAIQCGLIGTLTAGFFTNRLYGESIYWLCALAFALHRIQRTELAAQAANTQSGTSDAAGTVAGEPLASPSSSGHRLPTAAGLAVRRMAGTAQPQRSIRGAP